MRFQSRVMLLLWRLAFFLAGTAQDVDHRVVALVAGVLKYGTRSCAKWIFDGPGLRKRGGIFNGGAVKQGIRADAREPFDDMQVCGRSAKVDLGVEIDGVDHQRVAV